MKLNRKLDQIDEEKMDNKLESIADRMNKTIEFAKRPKQKRRVKFFMDKDDIIMQKDDANSTIERHFNEGMEVSVIAFDNQIQVKPATNRIGTFIVGGGSIENEFDNKAFQTIDVKSLGSALDSIDINSGSESPQGTTGTGIRM